MKQLSMKILLINISFLALILACKISTGEPESRDNSKPITTVNEESFDDIWNSSIETDASTGSIIITITEAQLTSYLAAEMEASLDPLIHNPQVYLKNEQIEIYGEVQEGLITANIKIVLRVYVDGTGNLQLELISADFGPLPAPQSVLDNLSILINDMFTESLESFTTGFNIESVIITDGLLVISGTNQ